MFERIWQVPRRIDEGRASSSNKFAIGAVWPPAAIELVISSEGEFLAQESWNGNLNLEQVGVAYLRDGVRSQPGDINVWNDGPVVWNDGPLR